MPDELHCQGKAHRHQHRLRHFLPGTLSVLAHESASEVLTVEVEQGHADQEWHVNRGLTQGDREGR